MWGQAQGLSIALSDFLNGRYLPRLLASGSLACLVESGVLQSLFLVDRISRATGGALDKHISQQVVQIPWNYLTESCLAQLNPD